MLKRVSVFPTPEHLPDSGAESAFLAPSVLAGRVFTTAGAMSISILALKSESEVMFDSRESVDCSPPGSSVHEILQARILELVAISFSRGSSRPRDRTLVSRIAGRRFNL